MRICPQCRAQYLEPDVRVCSKDGTRLMGAKQFAEAEADPLRGVVVGGRFKIIWRIGVGGMGTVYRAEQVGLDRSVALKILKRELIADRETVRRFEREAKSTSLLVHPNTVRVFDYGETSDGLLFLAMELLEGELLTQRLEGQKPMPVRDAVVAARQILQSLAEAHSKGIIHRDLKPDNIFLMRVDGRAESVVKVLDFGIAKVIQGERKVDQLETQAGTVFGTPRYMSPEQAQGKPLDARSDLYAVGVLLYQMITGRAVFVDDDAVVVMAKHIKERPVPPRKIAPQSRIPQSLERVVLRALEKDAKNRFANAEEFDAALVACIEELDAQARGPNSGRPQSLHPSNVPRAALWTSMAVLVIALGIALTVINRRPARNVREVVVTRVVGNDSAVQAAVVSSVLLRTEPLDVEVWKDGTLLGVTPLRVSLAEGGASVSVTLRRQGFADATVTLTRDDPTPLVALAPSVRAGESTSSTHRPVASGRDAGTRGGASTTTQNTSPTTPADTAEVPHEAVDTSMQQPPSMQTPTSTSMEGSSNDPYERFE